MESCVECSLVKKKAVQSYFRTDAELKGLHEALMYIKMICFSKATHILFINISASFSNAFQALANDGHHMLLRVREQAVALSQLLYSPLVQVLQFLGEDTTVALTPSSLEKSDEKAL